MRNQRKFSTNLLLFRYERDARASWGINFILAYLVFGFYSCSSKVEANKLTTKDSTMDQINEKSDFCNNKNFTNCKVVNDSEKVELWIGLKSSIPIYNINYISYLKSFAYWTAIKDSKALEVKLKIYYNNDSLVENRNSDKVEYSIPEDQMSQLAPFFNLVTIKDYNYLSHFAESLILVLNDHGKEIEVLEGHRDIFGILSLCLSGNFLAEYIFSEIKIQILNKGILEENLNDALLNFKFKL
ncbi:MAG: hypothetical protein R2799_01880 [Crocinitomicaceae bacterium]